MKILVTGGAGFIGSNFLQKMVKKYRQDTFVNLDLLTYAGNEENLIGLDACDNYCFVHGDVADREFIFSLFQTQAFDIVIHFAAESHVDNSILDPGIFLRTNVIGTQILLDASVKFGVKRFHQVSTDEVYGELPLDKKDLFFTEQSEIKPSSPYSASKASADLLCLAYYRTYHLPVTVSRCSNNYGPNQFPEKLIPLMIMKATQNEPLPVYGNGENVRDWLYVEDHCDAIDCIVRKGTPGEIYNIGGHNEKTCLEVVRAILGILEKPETLITFVSDRPGHDRRYAIDPKKTETTLFWKPQTGFEEGIKKTVTWYLMNPNWCAHIKDGTYRKGIEKSIVQNRMSPEMRPCPMEGLYLIEPKIIYDNRGYFSETYHTEDFIRNNIQVTFVQENESKSKKGVLRGMHYQKEHSQDKLVRVTKGSVFDAVIDFRDGSETYGKWYGVVLSEDNHRQLFVPKGFAHGYLVLSEEAVFHYKCSDYYHPEDEDGILWEDETIGIRWPIAKEDVILSIKDSVYQTFQEKQPKLCVRKGNS